jgi:serine/threonine-protein kinase
MTPEASSEFARFGSALAGQYELECEIGRGGMGIVYLARDLRLDRRVAIKTLPPHLAGDSVVRERFLREARTAGRLSHPNIVPIHRADELGGHVFFVMGFVDGESMAQRIRALGRIDPREVIRQLSDVADALQYAHDRGIVHRDVKAENILLDGMTGRAMVTDFGIARMAEAAPLTSTGQVLGTVYYLSPEQVSGDPVDSRSDIYSLGVVAYLALAGRFPFDAELASAVLIAHVNKRAPALGSVVAGIPGALAEVIDRCLAKNPGDRFQSCSELADTLASISDRVDHEIAAARSTLVSRTEAHDILSRAADLQAQTGIEPRPVLPVVPRDPKRDAMLQTGHRLPDLRDAAAEAGIPAKYFDRALSEHGLGTEPKSVGFTDHTIRESRFVGAPTRLEFEIVVDGEMPVDDFDLLLEIIRQAAGEAGEMSIVGRSFSWQSHPAKGNINISVIPRAGKTRIRLSESIKAAAGGLIGGMMGGIGGGSITVWV